METQTVSAEKSLLDTIFYYLAIWLRYKWLVILSTFVITGAVFGYCLMSVILPPSQSPMPNYYTSQATILIQQNTQNDMSSTILAALGIASGSAPQSFDYGSQVMQMMRSRTIIDQLILEFEKLNSMPIESKERRRDMVLMRFQFSYAPTTGMMNISFTDSDPVLAKDIVNRMIGLLDEWYNQNRNQSRQKQQLLLEEKINAVKKDITTLRNRLKVIPDIDPNYAQYTSELDVQQRIYDTLLPQYEAAKLAPENEPVFKVFELAEVPGIKAGPSRGKFIMMAFAGSFAGSSGLAFLLNFLKSVFRARAKRK